MKQSLITLLLLATLLPAAQRNQDTQTYTTIAVPAPAPHHSHHRLWLTIGILAASGIATGAILASESRHHPKPIAATCLGGGPAVGPHLCSLSGAR